MKQESTSVLSELNHGHHSCLIFSDPSDRIRVTAPFLKFGLERNEKCLYVGDEESVDAVRAALGEADVNVELETRKGRLVLSSNRDYLDGEDFNSERMLSFLQQGYDSAIESGFSALRAAGDVAWEVGPRRDFKEIVYYETLLDLFFLGKRMVGMCQYRRDACPPETLEGILNTHRLAAVDGELCSNFHYVPPELLLEKDQDVRHSKRVEWFTSQLLRAKKAEEEVHRVNEELEERVRRRTAELEASYRDMESFSYSVSHDLRAPLRAIEGFARIIEEDWGAKLGREGLAGLGKIRENAQRMSEVISDLLALAKLTPAEIRTQTVNMSQLASEAAQETRAEFARIQDLPPAQGDRSLIRQVLVNLLSNAVKFSAKRPNPRIEVGAKNIDGATTYYVRDNGIGFPMEYAGKLFTPFHRLHSREDFEGTGVGLSIVERIVKKHGGKIWAESSPGQGATFFFTLAPQE